MEIHPLTNIASQVRRDILGMVHGCQSGHPCGSLMCIDFWNDLTTLNTNEIKY